jgi:hypothetical protein
MAMPIEHFKWTIHAEERLPQRGYDDIDAVRIVSAWSKNRRKRR